MVNDRDTRIAAFKADLAALFERHGLALWFYKGGFDANDASLSIVATTEGALDLDALAWHDLGAERVEEAAEKAETARIHGLWDEQKDWNRILARALLPVFLRHEMVLWTPGQHARCYWYLVRALPFTEERLAHLVLKGRFLANSLRSQMLAERQLTEAHRARLPAFWADVTCACREAQLVPVAFSFGQGVEDAVPDEDADDLMVSPRFDDPLPDWLVNL